MKIYIDKIPSNCYECELCGKLKPPAYRPEIECLCCNLMKKIDSRYEHCPLKSLAEYNAELLKNAIVLPKGFRLHQTVYMIPTKYNGLKEITAYNILDFSLSDIGKRANLSICKKERGIEPFYCASFEMFNTSIFATKEQATAQQEKLRGGSNG